MQRRSLRALWGTTLVATVCALSACGGDGNHGADDEDKASGLELTILHINDHHSNLAPKKTNLLLDTGTGKRETVSVSAAGFARVAQAMQDLGSQADNVLKLHAGDAMTGTLYFNRAGAEGEADAALMNTVCFDAFTLGNHEFDKGDSGLKKFLDFLRQGDCQTQALSANVNFGAQSALHPSRAPDAVKRSMVVQRNGQSIGLIGLTIADKTKISSSPDQDTLFTDEAAAVQREIDALHAQGVNKIIVQSHIGYGYDQQVIAKVSGVDVVVGGDSHSLLGPDALSQYNVGTPAGTYPTRLSDRDGNPVCLVQAWEYSQIVGELKVQFDKDGKVTACEGTPHVLIGNDFEIGGAAPSAAQNEAIREDINRSGFLRVTGQHPQAVAALAPFAEKVKIFENTQVAMVSTEICSRRVPGGVGSADYGRSSASCNALGEVSARGGDIQQLVAQAYLEVTRRDYGGADISLQSGGGAREPLTPGVVSAANVIKILPFGNMLYKQQLTGTEVQAMIEDGLDAVLRPGGSTGPYPYTGGLRFDVNATQAKGHRASGFEVHNPDSGVWEPLDANRRYTLAVLSYNASGGDGYNTLRDLPSDRVLDVGVLDAEVFFNYINNQPKDPITGLPVIGKLDAQWYSTKSFQAAN